MGKAVQDPALMIDATEENREDYDL